MVQVIYVFILNDALITSMALKRQPIISQLAFVKRELIESEFGTNDG